MKSVFTVSFLFIFSTTIFAQDVMTPELLWQLNRIGEVAVSPDNTMVAFTMRKYDVKSNSSESDIYLVPITGGEVKKISTSPGGEYNLVWKNDSKHIFYIGNSDEGSNIFLLGVDGKTNQQVSNLKGITSFKLSNDQSLIAFTRDVKLEAVMAAEIHQDLPYANARMIDGLMYRHWSSWEDGIFSHIFITSLMNGRVEGDGIDIMENELYNSPLKPFGGVEHFTISPDNKNILYVCKKMNALQNATSTNADIYSYNVETRKTTNISEGMKGYDVDPAYNSTGTKIAWLSMKTDGYEADKNDIVVYDVNTKAVTNLTQNEDLTVNSFSWSAKGDKIFFKSCKEATIQFFEFDFKTTKIRQITTGDHDYTSIYAAGDLLVGGRQNMNHPMDIYTVDLKTSEQKQITDVNKEIYSKIKTGPIEKRWVTTTDGKKELVWVIYPPDFDKTKKYPALLYCQGGPQSPVSQFFSYRWNFQLMAANGYIVIAPNRRGLPGFGQAWNDEIRNDWGGQPIQDYLSAVDELKKEPFIDETRIGAVGASYGGYSVYYLAGVHENRFKCFISHCGLFNLESWYGTTEELFFANSDIGGSYYGTQLPEGYQKFSPHKFVQNWNTPMLVIHGEQDFRVPVNQGMEAFQALQLKGIESKMLLFPDENHFVLKPQNAILWHREFYAWLDHYLK